LLAQMITRAGISLEEALWDFDPHIEITLEANPSSVEASNFNALASAGVNRVSLGVQSLDDETLQWLGRLHGGQEAHSALQTALNAFDRVTFDLIYALPGQTPEQWEKQLREAIAMGTSHLSLYQLTIEPGTRFATDVRRGIFTPLDDDAAAELYTLTQEMTAANGLPAYEISNHARRGEESRHNLTYWRYQDYAGIGPGAHGRRGGFATTRHKKPENYLKAVSERRHGIQEQRMLGTNEQLSEALLMGLRLVEGIDLGALAARFGVASDGLLNAKKREHLEELGFIWSNGTKVGVTAKGLPLLDALLGELVDEALVLA